MDGTSLAGKSTTPADGDVAIYAELEPLARHRPFFDHFFILRDCGLLSGRGQSVFASPFREIIFRRHDESGTGPRCGGDTGWSAIGLAPRYGRMPRRHPFHGWMIGMRWHALDGVGEERPELPRDMIRALEEIRGGKDPFGQFIRCLDDWADKQAIAGRALPDRSDRSGAVALTSAVTLSRMVRLPTVAGLAAAAGISTRSLQRHLRRCTGLAPKRYASLLRFQRTLHRLAARRDALAEIAASAGYADQAHMTAEMRRHAGMTPGRLRLRAGRQNGCDAVRFFQDAGVRSRIRLLICETGMEAGATGGRTTDEVKDDILQT